MTKVSRCGIRKCFLSHGNARTSWHLNFSRVESPVEKCFLNDAGRGQVSSRAARGIFAAALNLLSEKFGLHRINSAPQTLTNGQ